MAHPELVSASVEVIDCRGVGDAAIVGAPWTIDHDYRDRS
jgi:hypothetical protein